MMSWNYRVLFNKDDGLYYITEAYYDSPGGEAQGYIAAGVQPIGDTKDELRWCLEEMLEAFKRPTLEHEEETDEQQDQITSS